MDEEKMGVSGIEIAEECDSVLKLGESSAVVGGEKGETSVAVEGEAGDGRENPAAVEMEKTPDVVAAGGGGEVVASEGGDSYLVMQEEGAELDDDAEREAGVAEGGEAPVSDESLVNKDGGVPVEPELEVKTEEEIDSVVVAKLKTNVTDSEMLADAGRDEMLVDPQQEMKNEIEVSSLADSKIEVVDADAGYEQQLSEFPTDSGADGLDLVMEGTEDVTDSEMLVEAGRNEMLVDPQQEMKNEIEVSPLADSRMEVVDTDAGYEQQLSEFPTDSRGGGLDLVMEGTKVCKDGHDEMALAEEENAGALGGVENVSVEISTVENSIEPAEEKGDVMINNLEVGKAEKLTLVEEERSDSGLIADHSISEVEIGGNAHPVNVTEHGQVHGSKHGMEDVSDHKRNEHVEDKVLVPGESQIHGMKMVDDNNTVMDVLNDVKLDEHLSVAECKEDAFVKEGLPVGDIKPEEEFRVESETKGDDVVEHLSEDAEIETEVGINSIDSKTPDDDGKLETEDTRSDVDEPGNDMYDSPGTLQDEEDEAIVAEENGEQDTEPDLAESEKISGGKSKREKLSKSSSIIKTRGKSSRKTVGEDVCFICFDGGELVLCDRRGCPKAYHPSCVNRDEAFFRSKGRWNCGWHLCSICEKNARYMCYTCTFSLCRSCTKDAVILCVRGNKGFCETCMRTVQLIEKKEQGDNDAQIDFDDRSSWEYLFKDYYIDLKAMLSLTSVEIAEAKNPWRRADISGSSKTESPEVEADANDGGSDSDDSIENSEAIRPKRRKTRRPSKSQSKKQKSVDSGDATLSDNSEWASRELLEFVSHMKDGDTSVLSQFDVQALLLEYIKRNKLRDPRRKSQIVCDARLQNLFGKPRVGHFEMLKLLESHFLTREEQNDDFQGSVVDTENDQLDIDASPETLTKGVKDKKRKSRKKGDRGPQSNLDDFAAIDMHNIGLIYLRRKLMEDLLEDSETFNEKIIGTFVRIRISGSNQKQDLYRLVQVVGTSRSEEHYKVGKKATDIMVEILNLDKTEIIPIDTISNQEFTEDECKRLRQSIKCGLISRLTVGEILDKTMEMQVARVNDWLESETLRLSHLRDRASDLGRRKELRECVEKLQLLKTPEERRRRMEEIPEIHADPKMDPGYESDDKDSEHDDARREQFSRSRSSSFSKRSRGPISPGTDNYAKDSWTNAGKSTPSRNLSGNSHSANSGNVDEILLNESSWNIERDRSTQESNYIDKPNSATKSESAERPQRTASRSESTSGAVLLPLQESYSAGVAEPALKINESEKIWHYQDPAGKVQGPFSMVQLRKWNNTGYFPANLKIWRATEKQENSILLLDALAGKFPKELPVESTFPATNALNSSHTLAGHSVKISGASQSSGSLSSSSTDKWSVNDTRSLPSPTPKRTYPNLLTVTVQSPSVNGVLSSAAVLPDLATHSPTPASVMNSDVHNSNFSPTPNSQQGILVDSVITQHTQSTPKTELVPQIHSHQPAAVQPVITQNPPADAQVWGTGAQSGQAQGYGWSTSNAQSSGSFPNPVSATGILPDAWRPTQSSQPNMHSPTTPNPSWSTGQAENNTHMAARPQNPNAGWGTMQTNPNMGWGNTNPNWGPATQVPPASGNTFPPPGNMGANMPVMVPGNANPGWGPTPGWVGPPNQAPAPGNGWLPPGRNAQGQVQGNANQGWAPTWGGEQSRGGGQFPGQRGGQGREFGGDSGRPWNRQSSFGGGGPRHNKRDMLCPYNANGRCIKGSRCDFRHN